MQKTVEGAQALHNDKFIDVPVALHLKTAQVLPQSVPRRKLRKSHIQSLTGIPEILMQVRATQQTQKTVEVH